MIGETHPDVLDALKVEAKPQKNERMAAVNAELAVIRAQCPNLLDYLARSTEPVFGTGEQMAFQVGRRNVYRWLKGANNG